MGLQNWFEVIDKDFPDAMIDGTSRQITIEANTRYPIDDLSLATGRFYTQSEYETLRKRALATSLP